MIKTMKIPYRTVGRYLAALLTLMWGVSGYVYAEKTLIVWWLPVVAAVVPALLAYPLFAGRWRWLTASSGYFFNLLCHLCVVGTFVYWGLLSLNYVCADASSVYKEEVVVRQKERMERRTYRRVGRNRMVSSGVHYAYYLHVAFPNGTVKPIPVTLSRYNHVRENSRMQLSLQKGFLSFPVMK